jgi:hypothetical protein
MMNMMDEMQKTLARRRAKVDRGSEEPNSGGDKNGTGNSDNRRGSESTPSPGDKVDSADLDAMKQEILREMRKEINKAKLEIIDAIRLELSKPR